MQPFLSTLPFINDVIFNVFQFQTGEAFCIIKAAFNIVILTFSLGYFESVSTNSDFNVFDFEKRFSPWIFVELSLLTLFGEICSKYVANMYIYNLAQNIIEKFPKLSKIDLSVKYLRSGCLEVSWALGYKNNNNNL